MNRIRNFIKKNIDLFNNQEPEAGHLERFNAMLDTIQPVKKKDYLLHTGIAFISAAAVFVLVFILVKNSSFTNNKESYTYPDEIKELQNFYENRIKSNYRALSSLANCPKQKKEYQLCMAEFDKSMIEIEKDMHENPDIEQVINVMINHYRLKLEVTDLLVDRAKNNCF